MRSRFRLALAAALLLTAGVLVLLVPHDPHALRGAVHAAGAWAPLGLLVAWVLGTPLLVPGPLLCAGAGLLMGVEGVAVCLLGSPLGAAAAFALARALRGQRTTDGDGRLARLARRVDRAGTLQIALVRCAPGLPVGLFNYAAGLTRVRGRAFVAGSALGAAPRVLLYGLAGGSLGIVGLH